LPVQIQYDETGNNEEIKEHKQAKAEARSAKMPIANGPPRLYADRKYSRPSDGKTHSDMHIPFYQPGP